MQVTDTVTEPTYKNAFEIHEAGSETESTAVAAHKSGHDVEDDIT